MEMKVHKFINYDPTTKKYKFTNKPPKPIILQKIEKKDGLIYDLLSLGFKEISNNEFKYGNEILLKLDNKAEFDFNERKYEIDNLEDFIKDCGHIINFLNKLREIELDN